MSKHKIKIFLIIIFLFSLFFRLYKVNSTPPLLWDEAALGYNAYSIIETGKDEYGKILPLMFKSFGDYKPGFYVYLALPFVKIFGLSEISTRLPSILLGSLLPIFLFLLIKEIDPKAHKTALLAALIAAFNPYNIHFSRGAWETNILTIELVLASLFFFKYINKQKSKFLLFSSIIFGLSLFTYQAGKMVSLFLVILLFILNFKKINFKKFSFNFILPLILFSIPVVYGLFFSQNANRLKVVSLFSYPRSAEESQMIINEGGQANYQLFYSQPFFFVRNFSYRYFNHFSPRFLTFEGDWQNARHSAPYIGVILYPSLVFLFIGIFFALKQKKINKLNLFFLFWLILAPIPAALTRDNIQAVRSMSFSIPLVYFIALGIYSFFQKRKSIFLKLLVVFIYLISFIYYGDLYLNHSIKTNPIDFLYGHKQAINYVTKNKDRFENIFITNYYGQPYIYYLFYSEYSPLKYQQQAKLENDNLDTGQVKTIDNIYFQTAHFDYIKDHPGTLGIFSQEEVYRQGIDIKKLIPLSPVGTISTFYAYENP
jgi:4-amino-4-deoxy-L-arabinose transferase-like glycosyltransferase